MPLINQNFTVALGDDAILTLDIDPDVTTLVGSQITWRVYDQDSGMAFGPPLITKDLDHGLEITDPDAQIVTIALDAADTAGLDPKNYVHEGTVYDPIGKRISVTAGVMTGTRTSNPESLAP